MFRRSVSDVGVVVVWCGVALVQRGGGGVVWLLGRRRSVVVLWWVWCVPWCEGCCMIGAVCWVGVVL
jgi:hypothetical protein